MIQKQISRRGFLGISLTVALSACFPDENNKPKNTDDNSGFVKTANVRATNYKTFLTVSNALLASHNSRFNLTL